MASMIRTFDRQMKREGKKVQIVKGVERTVRQYNPKTHMPERIKVIENIPMYVKVEKTDAEGKKENHDLWIKAADTPQNLYSRKGKKANPKAKANHWTTNISKDSL